VRIDRFQISRQTLIDWATAKPFAFCCAGFAVYASLIDLFSLSDESKNPALVAGFFAFGCGGTNSRCKD
jgi:hypothetical protein